MHNRETHLTERVSVDSGGGEANSDSLYPAISADGRFVVFDSYASNLVPDDTNSAVDAFLHDRLAGITQRVSVSSSGGEPEDGYSAINMYGTAIAFHSSASDLIANDTNGEADVFVRSSTTDSDGDGIPDTEDNCPAWYNPDQSQPWWALPFDDPDCDGWTTAVEESIGTDPNLHCGANAWPPDFDDNRVINIADLNKLLPPP